MKRSAKVALVLFGLCGAAGAQRGGHAAGRGGFSVAAAPSFSGAHAGPAFHGGYSARPGLVSRPAGAGALARRPAPRSGFYSRANGRAAGRGYYPGFGYGPGYPYELGYGSGVADYNPNDLYDGSGQTPGDSYAVQQQGDGYPDGVMPPPPPDAPMQPAPRAARPSQAPPPPEAAVTLVFKDGRAPLQIHNYALTRTTLYVTDAHHRDIPVADLDLPATQRANAEAGVIFTLPGAP